MGFSFLLSCKPTSAMECSMSSQIGYKVLALSLQLYFGNRLYCKAPSIGLSRISGDLTNIAKRETGHLRKWRSNVGCTPLHEDTI
jgi:hypothetical protein